MQRFFLPCLIAVVLMATGCQSSGPANGLGKDVADALANAKSMELISLDPNRRQGGTFHGWHELGRTTISSAASKKEIVAKLNDAINRSDGTVAGCFNPRHAVQAKHDGKTYEVIICFECLSLEIYVEGKRSGDKTITQTHNGYFNKLLADANVPVSD